MTVKVLHTTDVDGRTTKVDGNKLKSQLVFGDREVTIGEMPVGWSGAMMSLVFREIVNGDTRIAVCTGFKYQDNWYLDRPDDGQFIDAINGGKIKEVKNGAVSDYVPPPPPPEDTVFADFPTFLEWAKSKLDGSYNIEKPVAVKNTDGQTWQVTFEKTDQAEPDMMIKSRATFTVSPPYERNKVRRQNLPGIA